MWIVLGASLLILAIAGIALRLSSKSKEPENPEEVAKTIDSFVQGTDDTYDWDDFTSIPFKDAYLDEVRLLCVATNEQFPSSDRRSWCNQKGIEILKQLAEDVRLYARTGQRPSNADAIAANVRKGAPAN